MKATKHQYVFTHPKSPNFWYMRDIPPDVRETLEAGQNGKRPTKWKETLGTAILRDAARKASDKASEHNAIIANARATTRRADPLAALSAADREKIDLAGGVEGFLRWLDDRAQTSEDLRRETDSWRDFAADDNTPNDAPDPDWLASEMAGLDAKRRQIERQLARDLPVIKALGKSAVELARTGFPSAAEAMSANVHDPEKITLSGVMQAWKNQNTPSAPEQYEYPIKLFEELNGALPIRRITVDHVRAFRDELVKMPPASGGKFDDMSMPEIVRLAQRRGLQPLKASTAAKHFRCLKAIFTFAVDEAYVEVNVAAGIKPRLLVSTRN